MGLEIQGHYNVSSLNNKTQIHRNINIPYFTASQSKDTFEISSPQNYATETYIKKAIANNSKIKNITKNFNPELKLNLSEMHNLLNGHAKDTQKIAKGIIENLPFSLKYKTNEKAIDDAAYLHDLGKILIPGNILNKTGKLNENETDIMHKHSEIGYELLKNSNLDKKTLNLIRNHHQNIKKSGYPFVSSDFRADLDLQILTMADKYSALTEQRTYKKAYTPLQALTIIYTDVKEGKLHPFVFKALYNYVKNIENIKNTTLQSA